MMRRIFFSFFVVRNMTAVQAFINEEFIYCVNLTGNEDITEVSEVLHS